MAAPEGSVMYVPASSSARNSRRTTHCSQNSSVRGEHRCADGGTSGCKSDSNDVNHHDKSTNKMSSCGCAHMFAGDTSSTAHTVGYQPSARECAALAKPIAYFLSRCRCYNVLGLSTQVVVIDVDASIGIAFIAAQEARIHSCVLWDRLTRQFVGMLGPRDYICVVLYCETHPANAEGVSLWSIRKWREVQQGLQLHDIRPEGIAVVSPPPSSCCTTSHALTGAVSQTTTTTATATATTTTATSASGKRYNGDGNSGAMHDPSSSPSSSSSGLCPQPRCHTRAPVLVTCHIDTSLERCLEQMCVHDVRSVAVLADEEMGSMNVAATLDMTQIAEHICIPLLNLQRAGGAAAVHANHGTSSKTNSPHGTCSRAGATRMYGLGYPHVSNMHGAHGTAAGHAGAKRDCRSQGRDGTSHRGADGRVSVTHNHRCTDVNSSMNSVNSMNGNHDTNIHSHAGVMGQRASVTHAVNGRRRSSSIASSEEEAEEAGALRKFECDSAPPHVAGILFPEKANNGNVKSGSSAARAYRSMFDIPFVCVPEVGLNRRKTIYVTMDDCLYTALYAMLAYNVECIAICSSDQIIVDVISQSDLLHMEDQGVYNITLTIREVLTSKPTRRIFVFYERDTLGEIFAHFVQYRLRELFMVDPHTKRLLGQLNVAEIIYFFVFGKSHLHALHAGEQDSASETDCAGGGSVCAA